MQDDDNVIDLEKERKKKAKKANPDAAAAKEEYEERIKAAEQWLIENPLYYVQKQDKYIIKLGHKWEMVSPMSMSRRYNIWRELEGPINEVMERQARKFTDITYTLQTPPKDVFNMLVRDYWAQPVDEPHHWIFDVLMRSLGCDKPENIEHIEKVICYKYVYPECFLLPALLIHGEGHVGKNLLVDVVLRAMFDEQTVSTTARFIIGNFNTSVVGKVVVMVNEANAAAIGGRREELKAILHQDRIQINEKNVKEYNADNLALMIISSNDSEGGIFLDRSEADRRYSVLHIEKNKTLNHWIAEHTGWTKAQAHVWMAKEGAAICKNPVEVGKWIHHLICKYVPIEGDVPCALHGDDYKRLMDIQETNDESLCKSIFLDEDFTHIRREIFEERYAKKHGKLSTNKLRERVDEWLKQNKPEVTAITKKIPCISEDGTGTHHEGRRPVVIYVDTTKQAAWEDDSTRGKARYINNDHVYVNRVGNWVGPDM